MKLLQEMIDAFTSDPSSSNSDRELMKELFEECERLRPNLFKVRDWNIVGWSLVVLLQAYAASL